MGEYQKKKEDIVLLRRLDSWKPDNILDIGANQGESVMRFKALWPDAFVLSFEPRPMAFKLLSEVVSRYKKARCLNIALGDVKGAYQMDEVFEPEIKSGGASSFLKRNDIPAGADIHQIIVKIKKLNDLDQFFPDFDFTNLFVKIDVEGFAKHVIDGGEKILSQAHAILIEVNRGYRYEPDTTIHSDIVERLDLLGFKYCGHTVQYKKWRDGLWIKKKN